MRVVHDLKNVSVEVSQRLILTAGSFDGVHLGHRQVISEVINWARKLAQNRDGGIVTAGVLTFDPLPREVLYPDQFPGLLTTTEQKLRLMDELGIDEAFVLAFDKALSGMPAERFVHEILVEKLGIEGMVVGHDCRFGAGAVGDYDKMAELGERYGFGVHQVEPFIIDDQPVSSTLIRTRIVEGDLEGATRLLGRRYSLSGDVTEGSGLGRTLGFPTANIMPERCLVPPDGIYAALARFGSKEAPAAVNIGSGPTVKDATKRVVEVHILDFDGELYGRELEVVFVKKIRDERKFPDRESLRKQIAEDVKLTRRILTSATERA